MKVMIDISELYQVDYVSGIQRVVIEVTTRWIRDGYNLLLGVYRPDTNAFQLADPKAFYEHYQTKQKKKAYLTRNMMPVSQLDGSYLFFDLDSVWMNMNKRSYLLPILRKQGVHIAVHIYDIIPVTHPQFCHELTVLHFIDYLGAHLENAELVIANAQATLDAVADVASGIRHSFRTEVVPLGSNLPKKKKEGALLPETQRILNGSPYILMVGTLEPRKNHRFVLRAFEKALFSKGLQLVFVGRRGWNMEEFLDDVENHPENHHQLWMLEKASDADVAALYEKAFFVAFASYNEGFGLPIIEAFHHGTPVLAADIPVLRETGGALADYFSLEDEEGFIQIIRHYLDAPRAYQEKRAGLAQYKGTTWDECAERMMAALEKLQ